VVRSTYQGLPGFTRKSLQLISATASLLTKREKCINEEIKLIVVLAQISRQIVETCGMKQRCTSPAERDYVWIGAVEKDVLLILYLISIAQLTRRRGIKTLNTL